MAEQMKLSFLATTALKIDELPIVNGQFILIKDTNTIAVDMNDKRTKYEQIITLESDSDRSSILAPVNGIFYFVVETNSLWKYDQEWQMICSAQSLVPAGGSSGQVLTKQSDTNGDVSWQNPSVSDEQVATAVNLYLEENPVSGMTAEQEKQLDQNTQDVADLKSALPDKLDTNQGAENKGKSMVVGEDGGLVPENVKVNVDSTLSNEGEAADAKATGYELEKRLTKEDTIEQLENGPYKLQKKKIWDGAAENDADSPLFKVSDYIDIQVGGYSIFYKDDQSTVVREGWGTYSNIKGVYPEVSYVKVRESTSSVQVCEKIYEYNKLKYIGKYDVLSSGEEVTDLVYKQSIATNYTEDDIDFSKPAKLNLRGNGQFRVYNIWNTVVLNLDNCSNTEFDFPDSSYKVMVNGFADGGTFTYHKKPESHTIPSLALIPENASNDFIRFLEKTLNISAGENPGESLEDLAEGRTLVWSEEFNKNSLDRKIWQYEIGTDRRGYLRNLNEHPEINAFVDSSNLNLRILRDHPRGSFSWSGSILRSTCGFQFLYGLIEAKIKFPSTGGYMSFWLMGENGVYSLSDTNSENETINEGYGWPKCGEMDIAESDGGKVSCTIHYQNEDKEHAKINGNSNYSATSTQEYHIYGLEWTETKMAVYLDRNLVKEFDISQCEVDGFNPFNHPMHIVLSILNGDPSVIGTAPPSNINERTGQIDWVRVYAPEGVSNHVPEKVVIDDNDGTIIEKSVGDEWYPVLTVTPAEVVNRTAVWTSSNDNVVTVCPDGGYTKCVGTGYATITCTLYNGVQASVIIHVDESSF